MLKTGVIHHGDCLALMKRIDDGTIDLAFADPPFNIGYKYDKYHDNVDDQDYLKWCQQWIGELHRILKPSGTFWLAIGDEYAAELKYIATRQLAGEKEGSKGGRRNFIMRSWVVWYYTFGVNCTRKFNRSHAHLFQFIKDEKQFTFNAEDPLVRVQSARALVYGDSRANPTGRLPDDTWVLRPQDAPEAFQSMDDTWYYSRVAGTFKERQGFHGCQMPEQLLGRIIRVSSNEGDVVFDPFAGSGTTLAVAKKLRRQFIGTEFSLDYAKQASRRLESIAKGESLNGPADPASSSPNTASGVRLVDGKRHKAKSLATSQPLFIAPEVGDRDSSFRFKHSLLALPEALSSGVIEAFCHTHRGFSVDRLLADPELGDEFVAKCQALGLPGTEFDWKRSLLRWRKGRKAGKLGSDVTRRSRMTWDSLDSCTFGSEIAWKRLGDGFGISLDDILCDPTKTREFDRLARRFAPGYSSFEYRWAALMLRKRAPDARNAVAMLPKDFINKRLSSPYDLRNFSPELIAGKAGVYALCNRSGRRLYIGETRDLGTRLGIHCDTMNAYPDLEGYAFLATPLHTRNEFELRRGKQVQFIRHSLPVLNISDLAA